MPPSIPPPLPSYLKLIKLETYQIPTYSDTVHFKYWTYQILSVVNSTAEWGFSGVNDNRRVRWQKKDSPTWWCQDVMSEWCQRAKFNVEYLSKFDGVCGNILCVNQWPMFGMKKIWSKNISWPYPFLSCSGSYPNNHSLLLAFSVHPWVAEKSRAERSSFFQNVLLGNLFNINFWPFFNTVLRTLICL